MLGAGSVLWRPDDFRLERRCLERVNNERLPNGRLPPVGNIVDIHSATWTNTIGDAELANVWTDPDFNPKEPAFYYVRVLQIPTPRWVLYDTLRFGTELRERAQHVHQERDFTSPIWYTP